ncbi:MAG: hypothetical protein MZU97_25140 [Bacillus subtilis]|nr:hypothetical protein [Bacillus subtilis]
MIYQGLVRNNVAGTISKSSEHNIVLDGAHNIGGAESLKSAIKAVYPEQAD